MTLEYILFKKNLDKTLEDWLFDLLRGRMLWFYDVYHSLEKDKEMYERMKRYILENTKIINKKELLEKYEWLRDCSLIDENKIYLLDLIGNDKLIITEKGGVIWVYKNDDKILTVNVTGENWAQWTNGFIKHCFED